jgi:hypothetical protein
MTFTEGLIVEYENYVGEIRFVGNSYVTFCINSFRNENKEMFVFSFTEMNLIKLNYSKKVKNEV